MHRWLLVAVALSTGCSIGTDPNDGGQIGEESGARCEAQSHTALTVDEVSELGFAPQALVDLAVGSTMSTLSWADGTSTDLTEEVVVSGAMEFVHYEVVDDGTGDGQTAMEMAMWCPDQVEIEVVLSLDTADGRFAEAIPTRIVASAEDQVTATLSLDAVDGTFDPWDFAPEGNDYDAVRAWVDLAWDANGPSGVVSGQGEGVDGEVAFAEAIDIGSWSGALVGE